MKDLNFSHSIAPKKVIRGFNSWDQGKKNISSICHKPLLLGRSKETLGTRMSLFNDLKLEKIEPLWDELLHDCCEEDLQRLQHQATITALDGVIAVGGGKVLDAGKLIADRLNLPCITVPLSASTCAGWTALANVYSSTGAFDHDVVLDRCPDLLIFDHQFVQQAPIRTLASGIADALAKWYEASISSGSSTDGLIQQAVQMARVLRDQLLIDAKEAIQNPNSSAWVRVAEGCALTAGMIGGIGGARCRTVAAHAVHNGLTHLQSCRNMLHGEKVGFGILVQLRLEETIGGNQLADQAKRQLIPLMKDLNLPISLNDLGLAGAAISELKTVCDFACREGSDLHHLPFKVSSENLLKAMVTASEELPISASNSTAI